MVNIGDYYMRASLYTPPMFENREFAIIRKGAMIWRHLSFKNIDKLRAFLIEYAPEHVYFSSAKYTYPELDMQTKKKYWLGSDLIFDIDFDHLKVQTIEEAKKQSLKLIKILQKDFGFEKLLYIFSGNRGYHVHVQDACIQMCDNAARREIADYFCELLPWRDEEHNEKYVGIDAPVTCDVSRLIRLPGSIHGGSGKVCEIIPIELPYFNRRANIFFKGRN
jgi:DNA primase small subunit